MSPPAAPGTEDASGKPRGSDDPNPPTFAAFSPTLLSTSPTTKQRSTILVHRKSPLLVATPPAVTRALAFSHPFILPLNHLVGLLTWSTGDPWESFLLVAGFWAVVLYGDEAVKYAGPLVIVVSVILGMYSRRYSPLSSTSWTGEKDQSKPEGTAKHQKSLDEILETLNTFTSRCNGLIEPFMQLTDFLSTQRTATSATTRPALTSLFIRILFVTPLWILLAFPPLYLLTTRRVILAAGTMVLSWHSRPARVSRTILWRSNHLRRLLSLVTGLHIGTPAQSATQKEAPPPLPSRLKSQKNAAISLASKTRAESSGVKFTFVVFENQRRWLGIGWTSTMLAYERAPWTDEHLNPSDAKDEFHLPEVENGAAQWRWVAGSEWQIEGGGKGKASSPSDGWIYYDNKWNDGRRGQDGWGKYTRRRKWYRDAELVELDSNQNMDGSADIPDPSNPTLLQSSVDESSQSYKDSDSTNSSQARRRGFFRKSRNISGSDSGEYSGASNLRNTDDEDGPQLPPSQQHREGDWDIGDDVKMSLG